MKKGFVFVAIILMVALILGSVAMAEDGKNTKEKEPTALERYRKARETANQDSEYIEGKAIVDAVKDIYKSGKIGVDEFKAGMDYILGDGWEKKFEYDIDAAYKEASSIANKYFGKDEGTTISNFMKEMVKKEFAEEDDNSFWVKEGVTIEDIAKEFGTSGDVIAALFGLLNSYSFGDQLTIYN